VSRNRRRPIARVSIRRPDRPALSTPTANPQSWRWTSPAEARRSQEMGLLRSRTRSFLGADAPQRAADPPPRTTAAVRRAGPAKRGRWTRAPAPGRRSTAYATRIPARPYAFEKVLEHRNASGAFPDDSRHSSHRGRIPLRLVDHTVPPTRAGGGHEPRPPRSPAACRSGCGAFRRSSVRSVRPSASTRRVDHQV